jgi:hypothetical protein
MAAVAERFERDRARQRVAAAAAVLLGHGKPLDADLGALAPQLAGEGLLAVALDDIAVEDVAREPDDVLPEHALFFGEREIHQSFAFRFW